MLQGFFVLFWEGFFCVTVLLECLLCFILSKFYVLFGDFGSCSDRNTLSMYSDRWLSCTVCARMFFSPELNFSFDC